MSEMARLTDRVCDLEVRLSQVEAAVLTGPPSQPSQAAVDVAAQTEIARLRKRVFVLTQAIRAGAGCGSQLTLLLPAHPDGPDTAALEG